MTTAVMPLIPPVCVSIVVNATPELAFRVYTEELDSWWPKSHHIGQSAMTRAVMEPGVNGRVYSEQEDGGSVQWGKVLEWDPPRRFVMAWQITPRWQFEPDGAKCSEVEVSFTAQPDGQTLVALEHRHFERHGEGSATMRSQVGNEAGGWGLLMQLFKAKTEAVR
ncbi:MAG: SRPBCC family protein [Acidobacteriota bacterium]